MESYLYSNAYSYIIKHLKKKYTFSANSTEKHIENKKHKYEPNIKMLKNFMKKICTLLSLNDVNNLQKMWFICHCGQLGYNNFMI